MYNKIEMNESNQMERYKNNRSKIKIVELKFQLRHEK